MNILLGISGSVAAKLSPKMYDALRELGEVTAIATNGGAHFIQEDFVQSRTLLTDQDEWTVWEQEERVLHIDLRKTASVLVIAPLSADTLAKMANGICDGLLTSLIRAWDRNRPIVVAPAMNTYMWENPFTKEHIQKIRKVYPNLKFVEPVEKTLVCGDTGIGAMAPIDSIVADTKQILRWHFPLREMRGVPKGHHPGAWGFKRKHDSHTGVDLYCDVDGVNAVYAVESGTVVQIEDFTGPSDNTPWWNNTKCLMVEGASGVVNYGEIMPHDYIKVGMNIVRGEEIGNVVPVLPEGKERPDIPGHSRSMLHVELYEHGTRKASGVWEHNGPVPEGLKDPTPYLLNPAQGKQETLEML